MLTRRRLIFVRANCLENGMSRYQCFIVYPNNTSGNMLGINYFNVCLLTHGNDFDGIALL